METISLFISIYFNVSDVYSQRLTIDSKTYNKFFRFYTSL